MGKNGLYQGAGLFLLGLPLIVLSIIPTGCGDQISGQVEDDSGPFYEDRVVTVRFVMAEEDWEFMQRNAMAEQYAKADLWYDGELIQDVALRPKGNSSLMTTSGSGSIRFSLKADLNFFNSARNLDGVKKLNFNNGFSDPTFIREVLAYDVFAQMDIPTPRTSFVDLWVNDTHLGLYTMVEQIDQTFLREHFADGTGNLYKPVMPAAYLNWTEADIEESPAGQSDASNLDVNLGGGKLSEIMQALGQEGITEEEVTAPRGLQGLPGGMMLPEGMELPEGFAPPEGLPPQDMMRPGGIMLPGRQGNFLEQMGLKTNENKPNHTDLFRLLDILNNEPDETFPEEIEKVLDVDQVLRYLAVSTVLVHLDNYTGIFGHNYYLYEVDGKFTIIPWDLNMAFGTFNAGLDREGIINFLIDEPTAGPVAERPLVYRLLSIPSCLETYHGYLSELINDPFSYDVMEAKIKELADMIRPYVEADTLKFFSTRDFETNLREGIRPRRAVPGMQLSIGLKAFVRERSESIRQQLDGERASTNNGKGNEGSMRIPGFGNLRPEFFPPPR